MSQKVIQIGSSFGITVSPIILESLGWRQGTRIELVVDDRTQSLRVLRVQDGRNGPRKTTQTKKTTSSKKKK